MNFLEALQGRFLGTIDRMAFVCEWLTIILLSMIAGFLILLFQYRFPLSVPVLRVSPTEFIISQEHLGKIPQKTPLLIYRKGESQRFILQKLQVYESDTLLLTVTPILQNNTPQKEDTSRYVSYRLEVGKYRLLDIIFQNKHDQHHSAGAYHDDI